MSETVSVSVSGATFSLLFYENIKSDHDQDGFLLGNVVSKETNKLTDADHRVVNRERIIKVNSVLPCPKQFYFYNSSGEIDLDNIRNFLGDDKTRVVGWYIFKHKRTSTSSKLTIREKIIHKHLAAFFAPLEYFTCCLLTSDSSNIRSTYSFCQTFIQYSSPKYESLPLHINNLSDPSYTFKSAEPASTVLTNIVKSVKISNESDGHLVIKHVQDELQQYMKNFLKKFSQQEQELFKLEQEVKQLIYNQKLKREYGGEDNEAESEVTENGILEHESSENTSASAVENSSETVKKKRGRPRKQSINVSPSKGGDATDDCFNENEDATVKSNRKSKTTVDDPMNENEDATSKSSRRLKTNFSYSEAAQKKKV